MKKFIMVIVCLMTMVLSVNAQNELTFVENDYKTTVSFKVIQLNDQWYTSGGTITIDYKNYKSLGKNSMTCTVRIGNDSAINHFENVNFFVERDKKTNKLAYIVSDSFEDLLFILFPDNVNESNIEVGSYVFSIENQVLLE